MRDGVLEIDGVSCQIKDVQGLFGFEKVVNSLYKSGLFLFQEQPKHSLFQDSFFDSTQYVDEDAEVAFGLLSFLFLDQLFDWLPKSAFLEHCFEQLHILALEGLSKNSLHLHMDQIVPLMLDHQVQEGPEVDVQILQSLNQMHTVGEASTQTL